MRVTGKRKKEMVRDCGTVEEKWGGGVDATIAYDSEGYLLRANGGLRARYLRCWGRTSGGLRRTGVGI